MAAGTSCGINGGGGGSTCSGNVDAGCGNCGGLNQNCCPGGGNAFDFCTAPGTSCSPANDRCQACGGPGQPCCEGNLCSGGGCCDGNTNQCVAAAANCSQGQGVCANNGCANGACGRLGQPACGNGVGCTGPFTRESNGVCVACGGAGQRCCDSNQGSYCGLPFACQGNTCAPCGGAGQLCCPGGKCSAGLGCNNNQCQ